MTRYAANTDVPSDRSRSEIEKILTRYGATSFAYMNAPGRAVIAFEAQERRVVFTLPLPDKAAREFTHHSRGLRAPPAANEAWEQACRQRWRALALVIKAKLEAIECGITSFENEFLAHIQLPDGQTVGEHLKDRIAIAYRDNQMVPLLPGPRA
ncbi:MAG: hypothetical protein ABII76_01605 [Pseudomonadota bacterium]